MLGDEDQMPTLQLRTNRHAVHVLQIHIERSSERKSLVLLCLRSVCICYGMQSFIQQLNTFLFALGNFEQGRLTELNASLQKLM